MKFKNSIGLRLLRYVFGCYLVVTIIVTGFQLVSEYNNVKSTVFSQLHDLEETFKDSFVTSLWSFDTPQLKVTLFGMKKIDAVAGIKIENQNNELIASVGDIMTRATKILTVHYSEYPDIKEATILQQGSDSTTTLYEHKFPIEFQEKESDSVTLLGYGYIYSDQDTIIERVKYSFILIIINSVIKTFALWLCFLFFANRLIGRPLNALTEAAQELNPENTETLGQSRELEKIIEAKHDDELFLLADNFNQMRIAILERIDIIESQNHTLEKRVAERTKSLTKLNLEFRHLALHDALTSLPNRTLFQDRLEQMLRTSQRNGIRFVVAVIDLRKFKLINDSYGHQVGDQLLAEVAQRMSRALRSSDTLARIGGDEFAVLFELNGHSNGQNVVQNLLNVLSDPIVIEGAEEISILAEANIGTAIYPEHGEDAETLIKHADTAMYLAKNSGVNYGLYCLEEDVVLRRQSQIGHDIKSAIGLDQFFLVYQPIYDIKRHTIKKVEALVRWQHPVFGLLTPDEFIPIAERNGSIQELTIWVFRAACTQCKQYFLVKEPLTISVNLSGRDFTHPEFPLTLENICEELEVPSIQINLEITETTAMAKPDEAIKTFKQLTDKGFSVSIDDFGAGYSSFSYLTLLPANELKIDRSFLLNMGQNSKKVIKAMIDLAHSLHLGVVAEGVESKILLDMLDDMGCDFAQGYHIAKPLPFCELNQWLSQSGNRVA